MTASVINSQSKKISSLALNKENLRRFCLILQERADTAAALDVARFKGRNGYADSPENLKLIEELKAGFQLKVLLRGKDDLQLWGSIEEVFSSVNFPSQVLSVHIDSKIPLKVGHNYHPYNGFVVFLDFNKPKVFDFTVMPAQETPNESNFVVEGDDITWVNGVFHELQAFVKKYPAPLNLIHQGGIYDLFVWAMILPFSFYICQGFEVEISQTFQGTFMKNLLYVYVFFLSLMVFRCLFHYIRWAFPRVDYLASGNLSLVHRAIAGLIGLGLLGNILYDFASWLIKKIAALT